ncbi:cyclin D3, partial [Trifolium medium]|nr:cyclin D3 [Trifolium medium]
GIGVVVRDVDGVVVAASCWQILSLPDSEVGESLAMRKGLEFAKDMSFVNLIAESDASKVVLALNNH